MAGLKELKRRLESVKNTKKITYAMKLVAAAKLRKAQEAVQRTREYSGSLHDLLVELVRQSGGIDFDHPLLHKRDEVKKKGLIVIGGSRGLCGGYNTNINRKVVSFLKEHHIPGSTEVVTTILSRKPAEFFRRNGRSYHTSYEDLTEDATKWPVEEICRVVEQEFISGKVDEVYMVYTKFKSALSMDVKVEKILPMDAGVDLTTSQSILGTPSTGTTIYEPSIEQLFSQLLPRILRSRVRQACLDAKASEYGSRMTAMESATKNAGQLIHKLQLSYNKIRQSRITSEILDILGGAEAVK